jgi:hypothetical protein
MNRRMLVAGLVLAACAGLTATAAAEELVPFKGTLEGTYTRTGTFPFFHLEPTGVGEASHLGRFTFAIPHDVDLRLTPPAGTGTFEFVGADGDKVIGTFLTSATPIPEMPGFIYGVEVMTITGGTGRFSGATGGFLTERLIDTVNLSTVGSFKGMISSPGASNP